MIHGREYFFGGSGIESSLPSQSPYGSPIERRLVGQTEVDANLWHSFLEDCQDLYGVGKYHLLEFNCNTFSDAALQFTLGQRIDPDISSLPSDFLSTPLGKMLRPQIDAMYAPRANTQTKGLVKTEVVVNGPTSGSRTDRSGECFRFNGTPTLSKLFAKLRDQQNAPKLLSDLEHCLASIIQGTSGVSFKDLDGVSTYLKTYFKNIETSAIYPGLDLVRILMLHKPFSDQQKTDPTLLDVIFSTNIVDCPEHEKTAVLLLHCICNWLILPELRSLIVASVRRGGKLELISNGPLSTAAALRRAGLQTIWNLILTVDCVDEDFAIACLASVAECIIDDQEFMDIKQRILTELLKNPSQAIEEMAEILDLQVP